MAKAKAPAAQQQPQRRPLAVRVAGLLMALFALAALLLLAFDRTADTAVSSLDSDDGSGHATPASGADYDDEAFAELVAEGERYVAVLSAENFTSALSSRQHVLVEFYAPWCGHCQRLAPEYAAAAAILRERPGDGDDVLLAKVDATEEEALAAQFGVESFPTLKWFSGGDAASPSEYSGGRTAEEIARWVRRKAAPPLSELRSAADADSRMGDVASGGGYQVVAFLASLQGGDADVLRAAAATCEETVLVTTSAAVAAKLGLAAPAPALALRKVFDEQFDPYEGPWEAEPLAAFIAARRRPLLLPFAAEHHDALFALEHQLFYFAAASDGAAEAAMLREAANATRALPLQFVWCETESEFTQQLTDYFGVLEDEAAVQVRPHVAVVVGFTKEFSGAQGAPAKFLLERDGGPLTADALAAFARRVAAGAARPHYKSQPVPPGGGGGPVVEVVGSTVDEVVLNPDKDVLLEVFAPWCGHCQALEPVYRKLAKRFASVSSVVIAKMDGTANEHPRVAVEGFPAILLFPAVRGGGGGDGAREKGAPVEYEGDRTLISLTRFLQKHAAIPFELKLPKRVAEAEAAAPAPAAGGGIDEALAAVEAALDAAVDSRDSGGSSAAVNDEL